jgi:hypothetical protein
MKRYVIFLTVLLLGLAWADSGLGKHTGGRAASPISVYIKR